MNLTIKNVLLGGLLLLAVSATAQVPQELIEKAKAAGMTDEQIRQEVSKRMGQSAMDKDIPTASQAVVTDRKTTKVDGWELDERRIPSLPSNHSMKCTAGGITPDAYVKGVSLTIVPLKASSPKKPLILAGFVFLALFGSIGYLFLKDLWASKEQEDRTFDEII